VNITIDPLGVLSADYNGYRNDTGPGAGLSIAASVGAGASGAGHGGRGGSSPRHALFTAPIYGNLFFPTMLGSGGGSLQPFSTSLCRGGYGGGVLILNVSNTLQLDGTITANGHRGIGVVGCGAGSGGSINIRTSVFNGIGTLSTQGATTVSVSSLGTGGASAGGRIFVSYENLDGFSGVALANGGVGYSEDGAAGTILFQQRNGSRITYTQLNVTNNGRLPRTARVNQIEELSLTGGSYPSVSSYTAPNGVAVTASSSPFSYTLDTLSTGTTVCTGSSTQSLTYTLNSQTPSSPQQIYVHHVRVYPSCVTGQRSAFLVVVNGIPTSGSFTQVSNCFNTGVYYDVPVNANASVIVLQLQGDSVGNRYTCVARVQIFVGRDHIFAQPTELLQDSARTWLIPPVQNLFLDSLVVNMGAHLAMQNGVQSITVGQIQGDFTGVLHASIGQSIVLSSVKDLAGHSPVSIYGYENTTTVLPPSIRLRNVRYVFDGTTVSGLSSLAITDNGYFQISRFSSINSPLLSTANLDSIDIYFSGIFNFTGLASDGIPFTLNTTRNMAAVLASNNSFGNSSITIHGGGQLVGSYLVLDCLNVTVDATGIISAAGLGLKSGTGAALYASGGGHGGDGGIGAASATLTGRPYGSVRLPVVFGSSGGMSYQDVSGGAGGGVIHITARNSLEVHGSVTAAGQAGVPTAGGGSGGSIKLVSPMFDGFGSISVAGGSGGSIVTVSSSTNYIGGGGGGGRLAVYASNNTFTGQLSAFGGSSSSEAGGAGTVS